MKTLEQWMADYSVSHQNKTNKLIHNICVPVIFFTIVALLWKLSIFLLFPVALVVIGFYYTMGKKVAILGAVLIGLCLLIHFITDFGYIVLLLLFAAAWAGQFYGHKVEGQKPSFLNDLVFLLIGPLWVVYPLLQKAGFKVD